MRQSVIPTNRAAVLLVPGRREKSELIALMSDRLPDPGEAVVATRAPDNVGLQLEARHGEMRCPRSLLIAVQLAPGGPDQGFFIYATV
jgi:hypothetical protein